MSEGADGVENEARAAFVARFPKWQRVEREKLFDAWLSEVRRDAKIEELRRVEQEIAKAPVTVLVIYSEADGAYVDGMGNTRKAIVKAIHARADRLEAGK